MSLSHALHMDLIFWRHAEAKDVAEDGTDIARELTSRGRKQAMQMAAWLDRQLPNGTRILTSPALRCVQTVQELTTRHERKYKISPALAVDTTTEALLEAAGWPHGNKPVVLVVGHQPSLGNAIAHLLGMPSCPVRKGSVWWIRTRERDGDVQTILMTVQTPDLL